MRLLARRSAGGGLPEIVELAVPELARERAEEIVRLSRDYSEHAAGFGSSREVLGPALLYGLAHMHERYAGGGATGASAGRASAPEPAGRALAPSIRGWRSPSVSSRCCASAPAPRS